MTEGTKCSLATVEEQFYYILYDVTTLHFEFIKPKELKVQGFGKEKKHSSRSL